MKHRRDYEIAFVGLKPGVHEFSYEIDDRFFELLEVATPDFKNVKATIKLTLDKKSSFFLLKFDVDGKATVTCDRCGDEYELQLWDEFNLVVKLTDDPEAEEQSEEDPDVTYIARNESHLDVSKWLLEFLTLSVPMQHIHPDKPDGTSGCNPEALKLLNKLSLDAENKNNPIWKDLDKFKNN
jgi:uncharacterized metal-binding protein YceD (DUF177 family)